MRGCPLIVAFLIVCERGGGALVLETKVLVLQGDAQNKYLCLSRATPKPMSEPNFNATSLYLVGDGKGEVERSLIEATSSAGSSVVLFHTKHQDPVLAASFALKRFENSTLVVWLSRRSSLPLHARKGVYYHATDPVKMMRELRDKAWKKGVLRARVLPNPIVHWYLEVVPITLIAVVTVIVATYLRTRNAYQEHQKHIESILEGRREKEERKRCRRKALEALGTWKGFEYPIGFNVVTGLLQQVSLVLFIIYYFPRVGLVLLNAAFAIACMVAIDSLLLARVAACLKNDPQLKIPYLPVRIRVFRSVLRLLTLGLALFWYFTRTDIRYWPLHNLFACLLCIRALTMIPLPPMKTIIMFLGFFAVYDLFMVYVTPFFSSTGVSVMESAARGVGGEFNPMLIKMPDYSGRVFAQCHEAKQGLLGLGDIVIPGACCCYCGHYDAARRHNKWFRTAYLAILSYIVGLVLTFVVKFFMESAQPALVYIIPSQAIIILIGAYFLGEWTEFWNGINFENDLRQLDDTSTNGDKKSADVDEAETSTSEEEGGD